MILVGEEAEEKLVARDGVQGVFSAVESSLIVPCLGLFETEGACFKCRIIHVEDVVGADSVSKDLPDTKSRHDVAEAVAVICLEPLERLKLVACREALPAL